MKGKKSGLDSERFDKLLSEFAEVLDVPVSDFVEDGHNREDEYYWRKDYRYKDNHTLPLFLIELHDRYTRIVVDGEGDSRVFEWHDTEVLDALRPVIHKALKARFSKLKKQIVYRASEKELSIIVRPNFLDKKETLLYFQYKDKEYMASAKGGKIDLTLAHSVAPDVCVEYMHAVEKYLVPCVKEAKGA